MAPEWRELTWSRARLGEGLVALAHSSGLPVRTEGPPANPDAGVDVEAWLPTASRWIGLEAVSLAMPYPELSRFLVAPGPSLARIAVDGEERFLVVAGRAGRSLRVVTEAGEVRRVSRDALERALEASHAPGIASEIDRLLDATSLTENRRARVRSHLVGERLHQETVSGLWLLRAPPGADVREEVKQARLPRLVAVFGGAFAIDYLLFILSWWLIGRGALRGQIDWGWLSAWALFFATMLPFRMLATWHEGKIAVAAGGLLKRRLLAGAMRLDPDEVREDGAGRHLARVLESEAVESLALSGGLLSAAAGIQLAITLVVLALGAGGLVHALALAATIGAFLLVAWRYFERRRAWTDARINASHDLVERMVGHRTRLAQERPESWHEGEDGQLASYLERSKSVDRLNGTLFVFYRLWLPIGLLALAPPFILGEASLGRLAVALGGTILGSRALKKLAYGFSDLLDAVIAWKRVKPLFEAASREPARGDPSLVALAGAGDAASNGRVLLEATDVSFRYPSRPEPVLRGATFRLRRGDRVLLTSPSGGGKSTLVSLVNGLREPAAGMLLLGGIDRLSLGAESWTRRIATAPQFQENHVFTESFAFNLLMGRRWPPSREDWREAEALARELGLGELLDKMPGGMNQLVGDTGWQLSHGERSRLYLARALLQGGELVMLDESFAALDPDNLRQALLCARARAESLMVIAHP